MGHHQSSNIGSNSRLLSIDALRGIAALGVTLFHGLLTYAYVFTPQTSNILFAITALVFSYGYTGVFLFFVISGFCIHLRWAKAKAAGQTPRIEFIPFWKRRIRRLYPAYLVALGVYLSILAYQGKIALTPFTAYDTVIHLLMLHNLDNRTCFSINGVFWTLAIEEQLYLAYFLLLYLRERIGWGVTLFLCLAGRLAWFGFAGVLHRLAGFDTPFSEAAISNWFVWALGAVSVEAAFGVIKMPSWLRSLRLGGILMAVAASLAYADRLADPRGHFHELIWLIGTPIWGVAFFLLVNRITFAEKRWHLTKRVPRIARWAAALGVFSYSLYLTHELIVDYPSEAIQRWYGMPANSLVVLRWVVLCPASILFARIFYQLFEKPFLPQATAPAPVQPEKADVSSSWPKNGSNGNGLYPQRPVRVLHVTNVETGNYYLNNLADHTDRREVEYLALTFGARGEFVENLEQRGVKSFALDCLGRSHYFRAYRRIREIVRNEGVDIVHAHLFEPTLVSLIAGKGLGHRVIVTRHHSDALYRIPQAFKRASYLRLEALINKKADHLIAPSRMVRDVLVDREGVPADKVSLIPYGQTTERFDAVTAQAVARVRDELEMQELGLSMVCVARLHPEKGHCYLFEALAGLGREGLDAKLYLLGQGPIRQSLESLAKELGINDRVRFLGWRTDALAIIAAADVVVHPSLQEALPSAAIEALMLSRPLVVTDISGARDIVGDSKYGIVVPPADAEALRNGILRTVNDLDAAGERAALGRQYLLEYMDAARVAREYTACYQRVAGMLPEREKH